LARSVRRQHARPSPAVAQLRVCAQSHKCGLNVVFRVNA
jgi:hypothetical protein